MIKFALFFDDTGGGLQMVNHHHGLNHHLGKGICLQPPPNVRKSKFDDLNVSVSSDDLAVAQKKGPLDLTTLEA